MQANNIRKSIEEIEILRGILCIFVLIIHTTATASIELEAFSLSSILFSIANTATKVAVPGFIFISGFSLAYSYNNRKIGSIYSFYKKRFTNILIPYIIWSLIYYLVYIILYNYEISFKFFIIRLINGSMTYHLYFIIIMVQFYVLFPIFLNIFKKCNNNIILSLSIIINIIIFYNGTNPISFITYISYFTIGMYLAFNYNNIINLFVNRKNKFIINFIGILITIYYIIEVYILTHFNIALNKTGTTYYIFCLLTIVMYYVISLSIYNSENNIYIKFKDIANKIAKVSFNIYLIHPLVIILIERILRGLSISLKHGIMTLVLIAIAFIYADLSYKNRKILNVQRC